MRLAAKNPGKAKKMGWAEKRTFCCAVLWAYFKKRHPHTVDLNDKICIVNIE